MIFSKYNYLFLRCLAFLCAASMLSCQKSFLERAPISNSNEANFYNSEADFELAISGAYQALTLEGTYNDFVPMIGDLRSDNSTMGSTAGQRTSFREIDEFQEQSENFILSTIWNDHYAGIARCNKVIQMLDEKKEVLSEAKYNQIKGEASFLRALFYFNMVRIFGDVPLSTKVLDNVQDAYKISRTPVQEVYSQIEADLLVASESLPNVGTVEPGKATAGAAKGLLGKVYLTQHQYDDAVRVLSEVIQSGDYHLVENFDELWDPLASNSSESLFEVQFKLQPGFQTGSIFSIRYTPYLSGTSLIGISTTGGGYNIPTPEMEQLYETDDARSYSSVASGYVDGDGNFVSGLEGRHTRKYLGQADADLGSDDNWKVLRYADVLLMCAEALNETGFVADGEAFRLLNMVRNRAHLEPYGTTAADASLQLTDQSQFREAVYNERRAELAFEGHRWFDLVRTGRAVEVMEAQGFTIDTHQLLFPVPQSQIDINPDVITQNPGYIN